MNRRIVHTGRKIQVAIDESDDGIRRDVVLHPGAVAILPLLDDGRVVLVRNVRARGGRDPLGDPGGHPGAARAA